MNFQRKSCADPKHQLNDVVDYLEERYRTLGVETIRQRFVWRGIPQSNLIAVIRGERSDKPILMADHIDTAFAEDVFEKSGERKSVPGADDNATATSALLRAAEVLNELPRRSLWRVETANSRFRAVSNR